MMLDSYCCPPSVAATWDAVTLDTAYKSLWPAIAQVAIHDYNLLHESRLQEFGKAAWNFAPGPDITLEDAQAGIQAGTLSLDQGFFRSRWERATPSERDYMRAMAEDDDGPSQSGEVARRLDKKSTAVGPTRANLIYKGLVYAPEHGVIAFTVPGMANFIIRQPAN